MEKQRIKSNSRLFRRLLILIVLFCSSKVFAQNLTSAMIKELRIRPVENQQLFTNTTIKMEVNIPYIRPSQLDLFTPEDQTNAVFKTLRKIENYKDGGTNIEIWLTFERPGVYKLKPLSVRIKNTQRQIQFDEIKININPQELVPELSVSFFDGKQYSSGNGKPVVSVNAGETIKFRLNLKYAIQLVQYNWDLPKDSIFSEVRQYEITELKHRERVYSEELIPVADYEWVPLVPGLVELPKFNLVAIGYNGRKIELQMPKLLVKVNEAKSESKKTGSTLFDSAFDNTGNYAAENEAEGISREVCIRLADLRSKEKLSISSSIRNERAALEKEYGLPSNQNEFSVMILFGFVFLTLFFLFLLIIFTRKRLLGANIINGVFLICAVVILIVSIVKTKKVYAVSLDCKIYSIPEERAESKSEIPAGNRVEVKEEVSDWCFVQLGESGGWCKKDQIIKIK